MCGYVGVWQDSTGVNEGTSSETDNPPASGQRNAQVGPGMPAMSDDYTSTGMQGGTSAPCGDWKLYSPQTLRRIIDKGSPDVVLRGVV